MKQLKPYFFFLACTMITLPFYSLFATMHHHYLTELTRDCVYEWEAESKAEFDNLLISWNSKRPLQGHYDISVQIKTDQWSQWLPYAAWGSDYQKTFKPPVNPSVSQENIEINQDEIRLLNGAKGTAFKVKIQAKDGADLHQLWALHVCESLSSQSMDKTPSTPFFTVPALLVKGLSQMALKTENRKRLCSPTSTTAAIRYLTSSDTLDPIVFASRVWDETFDAFGNWVLAAAQSSAELNEKWACWVERFTDFNTVLHSLEEGIPVVITIRGPLEGSAIPYTSGHLILIIGFDHTTEEVSCMDPAFPSDQETIVKYNLNQLLTAWERRGYAGYRFEKWLEDSR